MVQVPGLIYVTENCRIVFVWFVTPTLITTVIFQTDKASILDETIEYLKSLQMQVQVCSFSELNLHEPTWNRFVGTNWDYKMYILHQIMWMTSGMAPMMFPGAHQFMPPMALGMNSACIPSAQSLGQIPRVPYMNHPLQNHIPLNSSPTVNPMNPLNAANQMQNVHLRDISNPFLYPDGEQTATPQV
jgi:phytochrome-interacting factor 4